MSLSILVGNAPVISAENTVSEKRIIFSDDFSKDKAWKKNTRGKMEISSGKLAFQKKFVDGIKSTITAENYNFQNGHIGFDVKLSEIKEFSVMFRMSNEILQVIHKFIVVIKNIVQIIINISDFTSPCGFPFKRKITVIVIFFEYIFSFS